MINRREFIRKITTAAGGAMLLGPSVFAQSKKIKIGVLAPSHCALPIVRAKGRGLFKKAGVNAELVFAKGMPDIVKGLNKGELDFGQLITPIVLAANSGNPKFPKMSLAVTQVLGINGGVLGVSSKSGIKKIQDLKDKRIGVHSPFMVHSLILHLILEDYGLRRKKDFEIKIVPMSEMGKALKEDQIDGFINPEPLPSILENKGLSKSVLLTRMFWLDHPCCLLCSRRSLFDNEKNLVKDVTLACMIAGLELDSVIFRTKAISEVHTEFAAYQKLPLPVLLKAFKPKRSDFYPFPFRSAGILVARQMKKEGLMAPEIDANKLISEVFKSEYAMDLMKSAVKEVRGAKMPPGLNREEIIKVKGFFTVRD